MLSIKNKIEHHLLDYEKVKASFSWEEIAQELMVSLMEKD